MKARKYLGIFFLLTITILIIVGVSTMGKRVSLNPGGQDPTYYYEVNESGQTYGSAAHAVSIETLPDLALTESTVDNIKCYVYTKDLLDSLPRTQEEALAIVDKLDSISFRLYEEDGRTVRGATSFADVCLLPGSIRSEYATPVYPVNEDGKTYGSQAYSDFFGSEPDLISAIGDDRETQGYVYSKDLAKAKQEAIETTKEGFTIPLYDVDGKTIIGEAPYHYTIREDHLQ